MNLGLVSLNLNSNNIRDIDEVCSLNKLPMLQSVDLTDNPITSEPDYRSQILGRIPNRINDVVVSDGLLIIYSCYELFFSSIVSGIQIRQFFDIAIAIAIAVF